MDAFEFVVLVYNNAEIYIPNDYISDPEGMIVSESAPSGLPNVLVWNQ